MRTYKIVLLGGGGVGKSAITFQFTQGIFLNAYDPTVEDSYRKIIQYDNHYFVLEILDTAGAEYFTAMRDSYMRNGNGFVLVYSVTSEATFYDVQCIRRELVRFKETENFPMILVGNKCDLEGQRVVTRAEGIALAQEFGCPFIETSAKAPTNIDDLFHDLLQQIKAISAQEKKSNPGFFKQHCAIL